MNASIMLVRNQNLISYGVEQDAKTVLVGFENNLEMFLGEASLHSLKAVDNYQHKTSLGNEYGERLIVYNIVRTGFPLK